MRWEWYVLIVCIIALILIFWGQGCFSPLFEKKQRLPIANRYSSDTIYCVYHGDSWGFSQWLQQWGGSLEYIAGKCLCEGDFIYLNPNGHWYWENNFCSQPNYSIMTIKEWGKLPIIANKKIFNKIKEQKMEIFKKNANYPIGTKLIYKDKIIEILDRYNGELTQCRYAVIGDAPKKDFTPEVGEKFEYEGKWYEVKEGHYRCEKCAWLNDYCYDKRQTRGNCSSGGSRIFVEIPAPAKHDKAGAEIKTQISFGAFDAIVDMAKKENVFITVEPVAKEDVETRVQKALNKFMCTHCRVPSDITILVNEGTMIKWYAERDYHGSSSFNDYKGFRVKRSPDVEDVEIV